jgi:hypothetical protein
MEKLIEYLNTGGFWFACSNEQDELAREACRQGILQPIENLGVGYPNVKKSYFYVRAQLKSKYELPIGMWNHFILGIPC